MSTAIDALAFVTQYENDAITRPEFESARSLEVWFVSFHHPPFRCWMPWAHSSEEVDQRDQGRFIASGRTHGRVATYNNGCRCDECREAARLKRAKCRARVKSQQTAARV